MRGPEDTTNGTSTIWFLVTIVVIVVATGAVMTILIDTAADTPAELEVTDIEPESVTVDEGENFSVSATVENVGETTGIREVEFYVGETQWDVARLELSPGESETVEFERVNSPFIGVGDHSYTVRTDVDEVTGSATVEAGIPGTFEVSGVSPAGETIDDDEQFDVTATIENTGELPAEQTVELRSGDDEWGSILLSLEPGEEETVEFEDVDAGAIGVGAYTYGVYTDADEETAEVTIESDEPAAFEVTDFSPGDVTVEDDEQFDVNATIENTGGTTANKTVEFRVEDNAWTDTSFELAPGESDTLALFNIDVTYYGAGEVTYGIYTEDDDRTATVTIEG